MNVVLEVDSTGKPIGARGECVIPAPPEKVWAMLADVAGYPGRIPMVDRVELDGDRVHVHLRFRVSLFSSKFTFSAVAKRDEGRRLEIVGYHGEPSGMVLDFTLTPEGAGTRLTADVRFEVASMGWLVKYFLKHHPEIEFGIFPGTALVLLDAIARASTR